MECGYNERRDGAYLQPQVVLILILMECGYNSPLYQYSEESVLPYRLFYPFVAHTFKSLQRKISQMACFFDVKCRGFSPLQETKSLIISQMQI